MLQAQTFGPNILKAIGVMIIFVIAAYLVKWLVAAAIDRTGLAKKANAANTGTETTLGKSLSTAAFWIVFLVGLMQSLAIAGATQISNALNAVVQPIMSYGDNILGALLIFAIFLILANVVKHALAAILVFADGVPQRMNLASGPVNVSGITSYVAFAFITLIGAITAFDVLDMAAISQPANELLGDIIGIIPNVIAAGLILAIFVIIARFVGELINRVLPGTGVDGAIAELGLLRGADTGLTASTVISRVTQFFIVLLGVIAAFNALGVETLTNAMNVVLEMGAQIIFGALIIFTGVFVARVVTSAMAATGSGATDIAANVVKWIIIILSVILGISRMGLDPTGGEFILNVAEYLVMGAAAALALAFGWGGKDWAARQLEKIRSSQ